MRPFTALATLSLSLALTAAPVLAQVQQANPNAANDSMSRMSTQRSQEIGAGPSANSGATMTQPRSAPTPPPIPSPIPRAGGATGR